MLLGLGTLTVPLAVAAQGGPNGAIVSISGAIKLLPQAPASVELWELESDSDLFVFAEKNNVTLTKDLSVDISRPGTYFDDTTPSDERGWDNLSPTVIPKGTKVDSFYFHFDNATYDDSFSVRNYFGCDKQISVSGSITFSQPIIGIAMRAGVGPRATLLRGDEQLGLPDVDYCEHNLRHFPGVNISDGCGSDQFILSADRKTLTVRNFTDIHHDNYRVILAAR